MDGVRTWAGLSFERLPTQKETESFLRSSGPVFFLCIMMRWLPYGIVWNSGAWRQNMKYCLQSIFAPDLRMSLKAHDLPFESQVLCRVLACSLIDAHEILPMHVSQI